MTRDGSEGSGGGSRGQSGSRHENGSRHDSAAVSGAPADSIFSPAGLKVLVVDDDLMCLKVVSAMLQRCSYEVTTCSNGNEALSLLRERNEEGATDQFDLVLSDVYMPDMDGFKLLEHIGLELDLPVIMMSSNGDTNVVLRGVTHGAVDFLIKPVRIEELRNVWQHVVRRRSMALVRTPEDGGASDEDSLRHGVKRKESEHSQAQPSSEQGGSKKPRVVWSVEMHQQFVNAVNTLGIDKAVPKRILDLMNVEGLTRENVASHLQKYRLYLKRVEGVQGGGGGKHPKSNGSSRAHPEAPAAGAAAPATATALSAQQQQQQQATPTAAMQLKQQSMQHPMGPVGMPGIAQGLPPGMLGMGPPPPTLQLHQAIAMQAAAAAAAASGALPGSMPPFMPPGLHPGMMPPGMPGLGGMMGQPPPGMMPPGMDMGHLSGFGGGMMFPPPPQPPANMPQQLAAMAPPPPMPPASAGLPPAGLEAALQCAAGGPTAAAAQRDACGTMGHCGPMGGPSASGGQANGLLGEIGPNIGEPRMLPPPAQEAQLCFGGFAAGGEDPLGHSLGELPFLNDLPPSAKEPDDFLDLFLKENGMNEEL